MEKNKKLVSEEEIKNYKRKKQLAIIKASNEMLEQVKDTILQTDKLDDYSRSERVREIEQAIDQNIFKAKTYLNATPEEIEESVYNEVSDEYKKKYKDRLDKLGKTEEDISRADVATVANKEEERPTKRKHKVRRKTEDKETEATTINEDIIRVANEDELMRKSMATDERIRIRMGENTRQEEDKLDKTVKENLEEKKIKVVRKNRERHVESEPDENRKITEKKTEKANIASDKRKKKEESVVYDFDFSQIPDYVQYDIIPLPSEGKCYPIGSPLRCGRVPVAYLTASDENIIASPNMYRDGKIIDVILERKILDKRINIEDLVKGDRDAIVLWLRATGYGTDFPIVTTNPNNGKKYDITIDLNQLKYKDFNLESDENGQFEFVTSNGDVLKFKFLTFKEEEKIKNKFINDVELVGLQQITRNLNYIKNDIQKCINITDEDINDIEGCITDIEDIIVEYWDKNSVSEQLYTNNITEQMILSVQSINGNCNRDDIRVYIENLRIKDSYMFRTLVMENTPGVNFELTINIPESDGGGSYKTFLRFDDTIFINI